MSLHAELQAALGPAYTLESELGGGGMARLFVAREHALERLVVVKLVSAEAAALRSVERFRREVALAASLQHPHIVSVLAAGEVGGVPYFIMPFVEGHSLRQRLAAGPLPTREAVSILRDVARACAYAHERGVVHRDIKPDNVLLAGGSAVITDFGIAKALTSAATSDGSIGAHLTQEGLSVGTPAYMAPEQVAGDPSVDHRADIYAFGVLAYEVLTGRAPFHGRTPHETLAAQLSEPPPPIESSGAAVPQALADLVMRCLAKKPGARPQSAAEIAAALDDPRTVSGAFTTRVVATPPGRRLTAGRRFAVAAGAVTVVGLLAWGLVARAGASGSERSVAVMPLINVGADSATQYFAAGLTDEISLAIGRLPGVRVAARSATAGLQERSATPRDIGRALKVALILEGTVQVSDRRLRLVVQLSDTRNGLQLWSERFEGDLSDVFSAQDSIASAIAEALRVRFGGQPATQAERGGTGTTDVEAYDLFLRGRYQFQRRSEASLRQATDLFEQAVLRDPGFARAYAGLADAWAVLPLYSEVSPDSARGLALGYVERALAFDSTLADALASRGNLHMVAWRWAEAEHDLRRAIAEDSTAVNAWQWLGEWLLYNGRAVEALQAIERAASLDPTSPVLPALAATAMTATPRRADAVAAAQRAVQMDTTLVVNRMMLGATLVYTGRVREAVPVLATARRMGTTAPSVVGLYGYALARTGDTAHAQALRDSLLTRAGAPGVTAAVARIALGLGDSAQALSWLEWAVGAHDPIFASEPFGVAIYDPLRRSPKFRDILTRVGLDATRLAGGR